MKKALLVSITLVAIVSIASAERMSVGAGYHVGSGSYGGISNLIGGYFQYDFVDWLAGRVGAGSISANHHRESSSSTTFSYGGFDGTSTGNRTLDISTDALPYISAQLLAYVTMGNGRLYFGPGYFSSTLSGNGTIHLREVAEYEGAGWNYNYDQSLTIKKQVLNGMSMTLGGRVSINEHLFVFGELMVVGSYQNDYEITSENTTTGTDYETPFVANSVETGKINFGMGTGGVGIGMNF